jgi:hypothetical protein
MVGRRLASALSWRCFPAGHHQLQRLRPTADPAASSSPSNALEVHAPPHIVGSYQVESNREKTYWTVRAGDLGAGIAHSLYFFISLMYMAFPTPVYPGVRAFGPLSPPPCQAWHSYGVSSAHHGEVRGCRRACERTPSWAAGGCLTKSFLLFLLNKRGDCGNNCGCL